VGKYGRRAVRMTKGVDVANGDDIGRDRFTIDCADGIARMSPRSSGEHGPRK